MQKQNDKRPEEIFVDRYMPGATEKERDEACENMRAFIAVLLRINLRIAQEEYDSRKSEVCGRVESSDNAPAL